MTTLNAERTVAEIASENMARTRVFESFGIDYCCGGEIPLADACARHGLSPDTVLQALAASDSATGSDNENLESLGPVRLAAHILGQHHAFLWDELPLLDELHVHVCGHHAEQQPHLMKSLELFRELRTELETHMRKEEQVLFPLCSPVEHGRSAELGKALDVLLESHEDEHRKVGAMLAELSGLHAAYVPAEGMCRKQQALLSRLQNLERDTHLHVHKENNILFPQLRKLTTI